MKPSLIALALVLTIPVQAELPNKDKIQHFGGGAVIGLVVGQIAVERGWKHPKLWAIGSALGVGVLKEVADSRQKGNRFDPMDAAAVSKGKREAKRECADSLRMLVKLLG